MNAKMIDHRGAVHADLIDIGLAKNSPAFPAFFAYLFPVFAMLLGAWLGQVYAGSVSAKALGAMAGFLAALAVARLLIGLQPALQLIPMTPPEKHHEH